ncbi:hypothetical protein C9374_004585 [Naegleria lovaniensis]|uniref:Uncharacterized protein n=1 Tax=Naegleria lovaniensis TaxID=51637 RepID=A0AA88GSB5_NAELO|nr:uncharacterized protein C9374_004585 [Naegleria lovaniensis]KAG2383248.1 hypothetical protein C9374_004585 [Naegleria lovaniensis]
MPRLLYFGQKNHFHNLCKLYKDQSPPKFKSTRIQCDLLPLLENEFIKLGTKQISKNNILQKYQVFKDTIVMLATDGDEYFPSQTLIMIKLLENKSVHYIVELSEDGYIEEPVDDIQVGDDFVVLKGQSHNLYICYQNTTSQRYDVRPLSFEHGQIDYYSCAIHSLVIKTKAQQFYVATIDSLSGKIKNLDTLIEMSKLTSSPTEKLEQVETLFYVESGMYPLARTSNNDKLIYKGPYGIPHRRYGGGYIDGILLEAKHYGVGVTIEKLYCDSISAVVMLSNGRHLWVNHVDCYFRVEDLTSVVQQCVGNEWEIERVIPNRGGNGYALMLKNTKTDSSQIMVVTNPRAVGCDPLFLENSKDLKVKEEEYIWAFLLPTYVLRQYSLSESNNNIENVYLTNSFMLFEVEDQEKVYLKRLAACVGFRDIEVVSFDRLN